MESKVERDRAVRSLAKAQSGRSRERAWLERRGRLLDERAFLAALGRGGAQRMAIPLRAE